MNDDDDDVVTIVPPVCRRVLLLVFFFVCVMSLGSFEVKSAELLQYVVKYCIHTTLTFDINFSVVKITFEINW